MTPGDNLLGRLLKRSMVASDLPDVLGTPLTGLHIHLDNDGGVLQMAGPLRLLLAQQTPRDKPVPLHDYLLAHCTLAIEGRPQDWQGQLLDLDFPGLGDQTLHLRGWVQPLSDGWLLQLIDIADLLSERQQAHQREACHMLAEQISKQVRSCSLGRLPMLVSEQLQVIAQRWQIPCLALALLDEQEQGWQIHQQFHAHDAPALWHDGQRLGTPLDSLNGTGPQRLGEHYGQYEHSRVQGLFGNAEGFAVPYSDDRGVMAWLLCGFYAVDKTAPHLADRDWLMLAGALAGPLLGRLREQQHQLQLERLESLQTMLGTGWWEISHSEQIQLAPTLAAILQQDSSTLTLEAWLSLIHPADREEVRSRLQALQMQGEILDLCVRLQPRDASQTPAWYRLQGQVTGTGEHRRLVGFMLDISDIKNQQQLAAAAHARLDNLIASSPAVIYVQH